MIIKVVGWSQDMDQQTSCCWSQEYGKTRKKNLC